jgi:hypothetical protein
MHYMYDNSCSNESKRSLHNTNHYSIKSTRLAFHELGKSARQIDGSNGPNCPAFRSAPSHATFHAEQH